MEVCKPELSYDLGTVPGTAFALQLYMCLNNYKSVIKVLKNCALKIMKYKTKFVSPQ